MRGFTDGIKLRKVNTLFFAIILKRIEVPLIYSLSSRNALYSNIHCSDCGCRSKCICRASSCLFGEIDSPSTKRYFPSSRAHLGSESRAFLHYNLDSLLQRYLWRCKRLHWLSSRNIDTSQWKSLDRLYVHRVRPQ